MLLLLLALVLLACRPLTRRWRVVHLGTISTCLPDALTGASPPHPAATGADHERYLFYSPQFGHSNQLVALRNAAAWAAVLNRTLVLPHLLGHATEREYEAGTPVRRPMATYAAAFDLARARTAAPLRVIVVDEFLELGLSPLHLVQLEHVAVLKLVAARDDYFEQLGLGWASQRLDVPMTSFTPDSIRAAFGGCVAAAAPATPASSARATPPSLLSPRHPPLTPLPAVARSPPRLPLHADGCARGVAAASITRCSPSAPSSPRGTRDRAGPTQPAGRWAACPA